MRTILFATAVALLAVGSAQAQYVNLQVQKDGKQVITDIEPVKPPPPVVGQATPGGPSATAAVIPTKDWRCSRFFSDDEGRRWKLVSGQPVTGVTNALSGYRLRTENGNQYFFTTNGRIFQRQ